MKALIFNQVSSYCGHAFLLVGMHFVSSVFRILIFLLPNGRLTHKVKLLCFLMMAR